MAEIPTVNLSYAGETTGVLKRTHYVKKGLVYVFSFDSFEDYQITKKLEKEDDQLKNHFDASNKLIFHKNLNRQSIDELLTQVKSTNFDDHDGVIVLVISHYKEKGTFLVQDSQFLEKDVIEAFQIPELVLKPKIFIFHVAKVPQITTTSDKPYVNVKTDNPSLKSYTIPLRANMFILRSCFDGYTEKYQSFVTEICAEIQGKRPIQHEVLKLVDFRDVEGINRVEVESTLLYDVYLKGNKNTTKKRASSNSCVKRGEVWLFNYAKPKVGDDVDERIGYQEDENNLMAALNGCGLLLRKTHLDLSDTELIHALSKDYVEPECEILVVFILSHGTNDDLYTTGAPINICNILSALNSNNSLAAIPVALFINACRGNVPESAEKSVFVKGDFEHYEKSLQRDFPVNTQDAHRVEVKSFFTVDLNNDTILVFSSMLGTESHRCEQNGTFFIRAICSEINRQTNLNSEVSLIDMLTSVQRHLALLEFGYKKQLSVYISTLTENIMFQPRNRRRMRKTYVFIFVIALSCAGFLHAYMQASP